MGRYSVRSSHGVAQDAAHEALRSGAGALGAVLSGFFAAAGADPGVLFSPVSLLVGGLGTGVFAYDGRLRQPGRGAKRPRGFIEGQDVPLAARAAVPTGLSALAVACAFHPGTSLLSCSKVGVSIAKSQGKKARADLIDRVAGLGARALFEGGLKKELLARFGAVEQGSLTIEDLSPPEHLQRPAARTTSPRSLSSWTIPWTGPEEATRDAGQGHGMVAIDAKGLCVALSFRDLSRTLYLEPFEVSFPALAVPVLRGITRTSPGDPLPIPSKLWLEYDKAGLLVGARASIDGNQSVSLIRDLESKEVVTPTL